MEGARVALTVERGADAKPGSPLPTELELGADVLVESASGERCEYKRR